jgi:CheY-like chemotaxis protein/signal transduction histidine kinase/CHASE3 domain sensor protein
MTDFIPSKASNDKGSALTSAFAQRRFLAQRLTVAMVTPLVLLIVLGVVLGRQILQMAEDARWVDHSDQVVSTANRTILEVLEQETALRGFLLSEDAALLEPFRRVNPGSAFDRLNALSGDNPAQQRRFGEARRRWEEWLALATVRDPAAELRAKREPSALQARKGKMDAFRESMRLAVDVEVGLRKARVEASDASTQATKVMFLALVAGAAFVLAFLSRRQLSSIATVFSEALAAEKKARDAVESEAWIRTGQAQIAAAVQGEKSVEELGDVCLQTLAKYTRAEVGAFFTRDHGHWRRRAGFGIDSRAAGPDSFPMGEGLVGRAALAGELMDLTEVPAQFLDVRSGTGSVTPIELFLIPARADAETVAVLEFGFLREVSLETRSLLARIGENIANAVRSSEYKQHLRDLLEETQRQAEELQTQQEELRVSNEELEQQSQALQQSQARLENQQTELEQINTQLEEQTQALAGERDNLARAQRELQRTSDYKSEFLANMSHELRTPLNSSLILAKLLADNREGNLTGEQVKFAQTIYSAGNDLLTLINDILDLSKIEARKLDVHPEDVPLKRVTEDLLQTFKPIADQRHLSLSVELEGKLPETLYTDSTRLLQILKNLLSNALKFTERGSVTLRVREASGQKLCFDVKDTGIGIPPEQHGVIFEAFRQADGTTNRRYGGTGLGLSISRDLALLLGGELTLESAAGQGSTFTLTLPVAHDFSQSVPPPAPAQRVATRAPAQPRTPAPPAVNVEDDRDRLSASDRSMLIIEDDVPFSHVLRDLAHELDFRVLLAHTAADGLALAEQHRPSGIVLDVVLPDRSGLSVLDALKHNPTTRHIPVHVVSGSDFTKTALEMGAAGYAIKPVEREQLVDALRKLEHQFTQRVRRVLVVEDDEAHRHGTCRLLEADDVETVAVGTAAEALEKLRAMTFDCMVLDLSLPDRTGFDLLEEMQKEQYGFPPVIVYTGKSLSRDEEQKLQRFSQSIIIKGAHSPERLLDEVTLFLHQVESKLPPDRQRMLRDARHREAAFEGRRILIVEDDVRNVFALTSALEPRGAKVEIARNGREALTHLKEKPGVDLVLMDIMMPEMDGLEATREIRKIPELRKLPIIALTAKAMADDRENCLAAGANDYIAKPLDVDKLLSLTRVWMPR